MTTQLKTDLSVALRRNQANAMLLYQNYKTYHWASFGPLFRDIHLLLDDHATVVLDQIDEFAERAIMIDGQALLDPAKYLATASIPPGNKTGSMRSMIEDLIGAHDTIIGEMHADAEEATHAGDIGTADLYTRLVQVHQKQRWFLREVLKKSDGLVV